MSANPAAELSRPLQVLVVDDHDVVHWGLRIMLDRLSWVSRSYSAHSCAEAVEIAARHHVDVALVDLFVGSESGPELCEQLRKVRPELRILLISGAGEISPRAAASCGASGFVSKDRRGVEIVRAMRTVALGETVFAEEASPEPAGERSLTERERQVLALMTGGSTNREIAAELHLSPHTVKEYASGLYRKLGARNRIEAIRLAERHGLVA